MYVLKALQLLRGKRGNETRGAYRIGRGRGKRAVVLIEYASIVPKSGGKSNENTGKMQGKRGLARRGLDTGKAFVKRKFNYCEKFNTALGSQKYVKRVNGF